MARQQRNNWLPILASVGIGAAAYYSMRRGNGVGNMVQRAVGMGTQNQGQSQIQNHQTNQLS
ncbi:hypothetical protein SAMN05421676_10622 [Salinibacillus kushneri]|uniref:Uncharacterized protein n=1 Tax=Salinibacillus kushneri TaxID=237682 RepID=A0A1I0FN66_9BACI|nr:hypothetical protein [Salinibacillus kushneri]SET59773.1 hypothetical protein SAMN05421676_10622 [Salinibacillus kushneri]